MPVGALVVRPEMDRHSSAVKLSNYIHQESAAFEMDTMKAAAIDADRPIL